jgi:hypothetical protein
MGNANDAKQAQQLKGLTRGPLWESAQRVNAFGRDCQTGAAWHSRGGHRRRVLLDGPTPDACVDHWRAGGPSLVSARAASADVARSCSVHRHVARVPVGVLATVALTERSFQRARFVPVLHQSALPGLVDVGQRVPQRQ